MVVEGSSKQRRSQSPALLTRVTHGRPRRPARLVRHASLLTKQRDLEALAQESSRRWGADLTLEQQLQQSRILQWDANEQTLLQELPIQISKTPLAPDVLGRIDIFGKWCEARGVRKCPCKPWVVATYLLEKSAEGHPG